jgi:hypothetical protein
MPQITISRETYDKLKAFLPLGEYLNGAPVAVDDEGEVLILMGMESVLRAIWEKQEAGTLVTTLVKLSQRHPQQVFQFVREVLDAGGKGAEEIKEEFGFAQWRPKKD